MFMEEEKSEQKNVKIDIDNGQVFFADEIAIIHNPTKFILDFKSVTPRFDVRNNEFQPIVVKHNLVMMDLHVGKSFLASLKENVATYEKEYGRIEEPKALKKAVRKAKQSMGKSVSSEKAPSYLG
jgi:AAA15 family ATPase/GTPase